MKKEMLKFRAVGTTFGERQGFLAYVSKFENKYVTLRREPKNTADVNAIKIICHVPETGKHVQIGYVPKTIAKTLAPKIDNGARVWCKNCTDLGGRGLTRGMEITIAI